MKNLKKTILGILSAIIIFFGSVFAKTSVQECNRNVGKIAIHDAEVKKQQETFLSFEKEANRLSKQCPTNIDSFTRLHSLKIEGKQYTMKITVDEEYIDMFSPDGYKKQMVDLFRNKCKATKEFGKILKDNNIQFTILVYRQNGELEHTVVLEGEDFLNY